MRIAAARQLIADRLSHALGRVGSSLRSHMHRQERERPLPGLPRGSTPVQVFGIQKGVTDTLVDHNVILDAEAI